MTLRRIALLLALAMVAAGTAVAAPWPPPSGSLDSKVYVITNKITEMIGQISALQAENAAQQVQINDLIAENVAQQEQIDDLIDENVDQQADIDQLLLDVAQNTTDIETLFATQFRRLEGVGSSLTSTASLTFVDLATVTVPENTISGDVILVTCNIIQNSEDTSAPPPTTEIETELLINGVSQDLQSWTQAQSGAFLTTQSHSTFAYVYVPSVAEKAADLIVTIRGRSVDGRVKNFNVVRVDVMGR